MATRIYLHVATNPIANLPTTEQSTNTSVYSLNPVSTNFLMDGTIGIAQVTRPTSGTNSSAGKTFIGRWVSDTLGGTTQIDANTWTVNFAATDSGSNKFPATTGVGTIWVCAYVWRPGTGKVANIIDGVSGNTFQVGSSTEKVEHGTFTGAQVTGVQSTDVLCIELWADTTGAATGWAHRVYFDGTTENTTPAATVSNHAAFIETPQNITFPLHITKALTTETVSVSESQEILRAKNRPLTTQTISISESLFGYYSRPLEKIIVSDAVARTVAGGGPKNITKALPLETVTITSTLTRLSAKIRALATQTVAISEPSLAKMRNKPRSPATESVTVTAGTLTRLAAKIRPITTQTVAISEVSFVRLVNKIRVLATQTIAISETAARLVAHAKSLSTETVTTAENLTRLKAVKRVFTETIATSETLARVKNVFKILSTETITVAAGTLVRIKAANKTDTETIVSSETLARLKKAIRALPTETITISDSLSRVKAVLKAITESINVVGTLTRLVAKIRTFTETIIITASLAIRLTKVRTSTDTISILDAVVRQKITGAVNITKALPTETIAIAEISLNRLASKIRTSLDTIVVTANLSRLLTQTRISSDSTNITGVLARLSAKTKISTDSIALPGTLTRLSAKIRTKTDITDITDVVARVGSIASLNIERAITETAIAIVDGITKRLTKVRSLASPIAVSGILTRLASKFKTLSATVSSGENLVKKASKIRPISIEIVSVSETISRLLAKIRTRTETISVYDFVDKVIGGPAKHLVRLIEELDIHVSDYFYKARALDTEVIEITDTIDITIVNNQPINNIIEIIEEPISITDGVTYVEPIKEVVITLTDSISSGDTTDKISGKARRIGGSE